MEPAPGPGVPDRKEGRKEEEKGNAKSGLISMIRVNQHEIEKMNFSRLSGVNTLPQGNQITQVEKGFNDSLVDLSVGIKQNR